MGFLDRMLKNKLNKTLKDTVSGALGDALDGALGNLRGKQTETARPSYAAQPQRNAYARRNDIRALLPELFQTEFPGYAVQASVPAASLGWGYDPAKPYDYVLYLNGAPAAAVMVTEHNRDRNAAFLNAKRFCMEAGVPFINFYAHFPNERGYVTERLHSFLG